MMSLYSFYSVVSITNCNLKLTILWYNALLRQSLKCTAFLMLQDI